MRSVGRLVYPVVEAKEFFYHNEVCGDLNIGDQVPAECSETINRGSVMRYQLNEIDPTRSHRARQTKQTFYTCTLTISPASCLMRELECESEYVIQNITTTDPTIDQFTGTSQSFYVTDPIYTWSDFADNIVKYRSSDNTGNPEQSHAAAWLITAHNQCVHVNTTSSASLGDLVHIATR